MRIIGLLWCLVFVATPAIAGSPAALVTDVSGDVTPSVGQFDEVDVGTELMVGPGASLRLEHYGSCEAATVTGGSVVIGVAGLDLGKAIVTERAQTPCATTVTLRSGEMIGAGIVLRSLGPPRIPLAPDIVIAGGGAGLDGMRIERDGTVIRTLRVRGGRVDWPEGGLYLSDQGTYSLVLVGSAGEYRTKVKADRLAAGLTVLRP